jgi:hypothetical protein
MLTHVPNIRLNAVAVSRFAMGIKHYPKMGKFVAPVITPGRSVLQRAPMRQSIFRLPEQAGYCGMRHGELCVKAQYGVKSDVRRPVALRRAAHDARENARDLPLDLLPIRHRASKFFVKGALLYFRWQRVGELRHWMRKFGVVPSHAQADPATPALDVVSPPRSPLAPEAAYHS